MQETDTGTQGGAIDATTRIVFTDLSANDTIDLVSDQAADTQECVVTGRDITGSIATESYTLAGTTPQTGSSTFERVLKISCSGHVGTVTSSDNSSATTIATMESGVNNIRRPFYNVSADPDSGGGTITYYEKIFVKNNNTSSSLLGVTVKELTDGVDVAGSGYVDFDVENAQNGTNTTTNRVTAPSSGMNGSFDSTDKSIPNTDLGPGSGIGVWLRLTLPQGTAAANTTYTIRVTGSTV
jgi:hypothetical protein